MHKASNQRVRREWQEKGRGHSAKVKTDQKSSVIGTELVKKTGGGGSGNHCMVSVGIPVVPTLLSSLKFSQSITKA